MWIKFWFVLMMKFMLLYVLFVSSRIVLVMLLGLVMCVSGVEVWFVCLKLVCVWLLFGSISFGNIVFMCSIGVDDSVSICVRLLSVVFVIV